MHYTPYAGAAGMLLHRSCKLVIGKLNHHFFVNIILFSTDPPLSISRFKSHLYINIQPSKHIFPATILQLNVKVDSIHLYL